MSTHAGHAPAGGISVARLGFRSRAGGASRATPLDIAGYWLGLGGSYLLLLGLWYYAAEEKIIAGNLDLPAPIAEQFKGSLIASAPGTHAAWAILAVLEALVFLGFAISLVRGEFLPQRPKTWLLGSAIGSLPVFALMALGDSMTAEHDSVASLYTYFAATILVILLVQAMPPYRSERWLSGERPAEGGPAEEG